MADPKRIAAALQYGQKKPDWWNAIADSDAVKAITGFAEAQRDQLTQLGDSVLTAHPMTWPFVLGGEHDVLANAFNAGGKLGEALANDPKGLASAAIEGVGKAIDRLKTPEGAGYAVGNLFSPMELASGLTKLAKPVLNNITVYHGTPHKFEKFDSSKIGTGEGAQAYGHGLYFAQNPNVAKDYQYMLSKIDPENVMYGNKSAQQMYDEAIKEQNRAHRLNDRAAINLANAKAAYWENIMTRRHPEDVRRVANDPDDGWPTFAKYANSIDQSKFKGIDEAGSLYHVDLPDPMIERMLDWDKPLSEQPQILKKVLSDPQWRKRLEFRSDQQVGEMTGKDLYGMGHDQTKRLGIPGIKYLDEGSRARGKGTRNFVVFPGEESNLTILERK